ncbi:CRTAC1 family protein [Actinoplanes siamensis]|uniref:RNA-binding protein n=2 Tax=Actinoplanes siamensis TaxID=1223317 RepID=A0A919NC92_9ACTN|nr:CRTAC1 family protein [Actinoplanes siamensis]GIF08488.1 RNA-binding protein [Actinoplanes siamensis]
MRVARWLRRNLPGIVALALMATLFQAARLPYASAAETDRIAAGYSFRPLSISLPAGLPQQNIREVNQQYRNIAGWISSVGSAVAMNDLDGDGLDNDLCITDPRTDTVTVTPVPGARADRYVPFALDPAPLPTNDVMAPMGCVPGDLNEDGRMDLVVYMWGRTPIVYLARPGASTLANAAYQPTELVPGVGTDRYTGPQWNTNTVALDDFDGDGHLDVFVGNYFPQGPVLDPTKDSGVSMNHSMSQAFNGGEDYFFRWTASTRGDTPGFTFEQLNDVLPGDVSKGWALASGANDLDGDALPELYVANDFGPDRLLYNQSVPGKLRFATVETGRTPLVPKSKRVGADSFKGMGVDFGDLNGDGKYDLYVSNIATSFGLEESHFAFVNDASSQEELRRKLSDGDAPFTDRSSDLGLAWSGWGWDVKLADFNNSGKTVVAQATGFVKGDVNRWPLLQELAMTNDALLPDTTVWPHVADGDDIGGSQRLHFFVPGRDGRYVDVAKQLGLAVPVPTRGIATGDADGDGRLDFAVARQWDAPIFYHNTGRAEGAYLGLRLLHPAAGPARTGSPVVGAQATVITPDGRSHIGRVDGGSGHSGKRSNEIHLGLGADVTGPVQVQLRWRDRSGQTHEQSLRLNPGRHVLELGSDVQER